MFYQFNPSIHNLGNIGLGGLIHSEMAYFSTKLIDNIAYDGKDVRQDLKDSYKGKKIVDLCCGVGISTSDNCIGVDSSHNMLNKAKQLHKNKYFEFGNAENYNPPTDTDIVTIMYAFHEMPKFAWYKILDNSIRIAKQEVAVLDISTDYKPSDAMLYGEPYIEEYLTDIEDCFHEFNFNKREIIKNKVTLWVKNLT